MNPIEKVQSWEPTKRALLFSNLIVIILALIFQWGLLTLLWIYWFQSVIIGIFTVPKFFAYFKSDNKVANYVIGFFSAFTAVFFVIHYFGFHFGYFVFLMIFTISAPFGAVGGLFQQADLMGILVSSAIFFINHFYSFRYNYIVKKETILPNFGDTFSTPYVRILPMHLTIVLGFFIISFLKDVSLSSFAEPAIVLFFLLLKTRYDLKGHDILHSKKKNYLELLADIFKTDK